MKKITLFLLHSFFLVVCFVFSPSSLKAQTPFSVFNYDKNTLTQENFANLKHEIDSVLTDDNIRNSLDINTLAECYSLKGFMLIRDNNPIEAETYLEKSYNLFISIEQDVIYYPSYYATIFLLSGICLMTNKKEKIEKITNLATNNLFNVINTNSNIASINSDNAISYLEIINQYFDKNKIDKSTIHYLCYTYSVINLINNKIQKSNEYLTLLLNEAETNKTELYDIYQPILEMLLINNLNNNDFYGANKIIKKYEIFQKEYVENNLNNLSIKENDCLIKTFIASFYESLHCYEKALFIYLETLKEKEKLNMENPAFDYVVASSMYILIAQQKYKEAENLITQYYVKQKAKDNTNQHIEYVYLKNIIQLYKQSNQIKKADSTAICAIRLIEKNNHANSTLYKDILFEKITLSDRLCTYYNIEEYVQKYEALNPSIVDTIEKMGIAIYRAKAHFVNQRYKEGEEIVTTLFPFYQKIHLLDFLDEKAEHSGRFKDYDSFYDMLNVSNFLLLIPNKDTTQLYTHLYNQLINVKSLMLNNKANIINLLSQYDDTKIKEAYHAWLEQSKHLQWVQKSKLEVCMIHQKSKEEEAIILGESYTILKEKVKENASLPINQEVSWKEVQQQLKEGEAAIEIFPIQNYALDTINLDNNYGVFILTHYTKERPIFLLLNHAKKMLSNYEKSYLKYAKNTSLSEKSELMWNTFWKEIDSTLKQQNIHTAYFSANGIYYNINPYTFRQPDGKYVLEGDIVFKSVTNTKTIVESKKQNERITSATFIANPTCWLEEIPSEMLIDNKYRKKGFSNLPYSEEEVTNIAKICDSLKIATTIYKKLAATEEKIKEIHSPSILHISAHGNVESPTYIVNGEYLNDNFISLVGSKNSYDMRNDKAELVVRKEDGILDGDEIQYLDLANTQLVVLSACESAVGSLRLGEGTNSLQRAFFLAGTKKVIASLWEVEDKGTSVFMKLFYSKWLVEKKDIHLAFKETQLAMMKANYPSSVWAAFILIER